MKKSLDALRAEQIPARRTTDPRWACPPWPEHVPGNIRPIQTFWPRMLAEGEITWCHLLMSHPRSLEPGPLDHFGLVVFSFDPWFEREPARLKSISERIFDLDPQREPAWPWEAQIWAWRHEADVAPPFDAPLPPSMAQGRAVSMSTVVFFRDHLPKGYLAGAVLPLITLRTGTRRIGAILPAPLWPDEALRRWAR